MFGKSLPYFAVAAPDLRCRNGAAPPIRPGRAGKKNAVESSLCDRSISRGIDAALNGTSLPTT